MRLHLLHPLAPGGLAFLVLLLLPTSGLAQNYSDYHYAGYEYYDETFIEDPMLPEHEDEAYVYEEYAYNYEQPLPEDPMLPEEEYVYDYSVPAYNETPVEEEPASYHSAYPESAYPEESDIEEAAPAEDPYFEPYEEAYVQEAMLPEDDDPYYDYQEPYEAPPAAEVLPSEPYEAPAEAPANESYPAAEPTPSASSYPGESEPASELEPSPAESYPEEDEPALADEPALPEDFEEEEPAFAEDPICEPTEPADAIPHEITENTPTRWAASETYVLWEGTYATIIKDEYETRVQVFGADTFTDFDWKQEIIDKMWNYDTCAWENVTRNESRTHDSLQKGPNINNYSTAYSSKSYQGEGDGWQGRAFWQAVSGSTYKTKAAANGDLIDYVNTSYYGTTHRTKVTRGMEVHLTGQVNNEGEVLYEVTWYTVDGPVVKTVTADKLPFLDSEPPIPPMA